jgi:hypothetical protein
MISIDNYVINVQAVPQSRDRAGADSRHPGRDVGNSTILDSLAMLRRA